MEHHDHYVEVAPQQVVCGRPSCQQGLSAPEVAAAPGPEEKSHGQDNEDHPHQQYSQRHHLHHWVVICTCSAAWTTPTSCLFDTLRKSETLF